MANDAIFFNILRSINFEPHNNHLPHVKFEENIYI